MINNYLNLPGIFVSKEDGNLRILDTVPGNITLLLGTAPTGPVGKLYLVTDTTTAERIFDAKSTKQGTLLKGMYETLENGAKYVALYRINAQPMTLDINTFTIVSVNAYDNLEADYKIFAGKDSNNNPIVRLYTVDGNLVYDSSTGYTNNQFSVTITGSTDLLGTVTIGSASNVASCPLIKDLEQALLDAGITSEDLPNYFKLSTSKSGVTENWNELYTALAQAYWNLEDANVDLVVPLGVYLDAPNIVKNDGTLDNTAAWGTHLLLGAELEINGDVYVFFNTSQTATSNPVNPDLNDIVTKTGLTIDDIKNKISEEGGYHELNFAYQLALFLHNLSKNNTEAFGVISVMPPKEFSKKSIATWLGKSPTYAFDGSIIINGKGILGNKFMVGTVSREPGFFLTTNGYLDGTVALDFQNKRVDIGRYIDIVATPVIVRNLYDGTSVGYVSNGATIYGGLVMGLDPNVAPTNKKFKGDVRLSYRLHKSYLDKLVNARYVCFTEAPDGTVKVVDAPTAALKTSDWSRRSTNRIVGAIIDWVRGVAEPFIGTMTTAAIRQHLEDIITNGLVNFQHQGWIDAGQATLRQTPIMQTQGIAALRLILKVPGELRQIHVYVALTK